MIPENVDFGNQFFFFGAGFANLLRAARGAEMEEEIIIVIDFSVPNKEL
jgi:hypothetical protein